MENTPTNPFVALIDKLRYWVRTSTHLATSGPYLPIILTVFFVVTVVSHVALVLMSQPVSYWKNPETAVGFGVFGERFAFNLIGMITAVAVYLVIAVFLVTFVNFRYSLVGWMAAEFAHFYLIIDSLQACYISRWSDSLSYLCQYANNGFLWLVFAILVGAILVFNFQPAEFSLANKKIQKGVSFLAFGLPTAWVALMIAVLIYSTRVPNYGWVRVDMEDGPGPTQEAESVYDIGRNRLVMFGGVSKYLGNNQWDYIIETWEWDGHRWYAIFSEENPPPRTDHSMAYDPARGVTVLFGGYAGGERLSDTWEWDGKTWKKMEPDDFPSMRSGHEMVYDPARQRVILYGGYGDDVFHNDAWAWDGKNWEQIELDSAAPTASVFALTYDPLKEEILGLLSGTGGTWRWSGETWTRLTLDVEPSNRGWATLVFDPSRKLFFTFGGNSQDTILNDTWTFNGEEWTEYTIRGLKPAPRMDAVLWFDPIRGHVMLFGGYGKDDIFSDMWEFIPPEE